MSNMPDALNGDFPDKAEVIHALKAKTRHFARLIDAHHAVCRAMQDAETRLDRPSAQGETELRQTQIRRQDQIWKLSVA